MRQDAMLCRKAEKNQHIWGQKVGSSPASMGTRAWGFVIETRPHHFLITLGVAYPLCASIFLTVKWLIIAITSCDLCEVSLTINEALEGRPGMWYGLSPWYLSYGQEPGKLRPEPGESLAAHTSGNLSSLSPCRGSVWEQYTKWDKWYTPAPIIKHLNIHGLIAILNSFSGEKIHVPSY